jgi:arylsulfatase A-like enzyme
VERPQAKPNPPLEQLFDLSADPHEETDLAQSPDHLQTLAQLRARCDKYRLTLK